MAYVAGNGYDGIAGDILASPIATQGLRSESSYYLFTSGDVSSESLVWPDNLVDERVHSLLGRIHAHVDLLDDHLTLFLHLAGIELRATDHIS
ncbi:MAG: hypothetical protein DDT24_00931 [Chloroflexi bacterium]|nr:hypothetical protein [Chloroflexota bacterium]